MQAVILAAGESSRFWPLSANRHKSLFHICGKPLIQHTLDSLDAFDIDRVIVVQSPAGDIEQEVDEENSFDLEFVTQEEPNGMAHALQQARDRLGDVFLVLTPYRSNAGSLLQKMMDKYTETGADAVLLSKKTDKPWKYGILDITKDRVEGLEEKPAQGDERSDNRVVGMYLLPTELFEYIDRTTRHEYQFEDALDTYIREKDVRVVTTTMDAASLKYPWDLFDVTDELFSTLERSIAPGADIADSAVVEGPVVIKDGVTVYENAVIRGPCYIGRDCVIGNNAVIRNHTDLERGVVVGANSEVRGSLLQQETHTHQAFIGDTIIGRNVRIGAGTVFANRNVRSDDGRSSISVHLGQRDETEDSGRERLGGMVGDCVDIGTQANIMPGIQIGSNSFVGPSTCLLENVGEDTTAYTNFETVRKER